MAPSLTIEPTAIPEVLLVKTPIHGDARGFLFEAYSNDAFGALGFSADFVQDNFSLSQKGTLRGLHFQRNPHAQGKLVRAVQGALYDVAVDLRAGSPTEGKAVGALLSRENGHALWVPPGFAHGFLALEDDTLLFYKCTSCYSPESEGSLAYNDPALNIEWPIEPTILSDRDKVAPSFAEVEHNFVYNPA